MHVIRGGWVVEGRGGWRGGWEARSGLNHQLGLFGLAMSPKEPAIGPNMLEWRNRRLPTPRVNFRPMPSM